MVADIRIKIDSKAVHDALHRLVAALPAGGDMTPTMASLGRVLKTGAQLRFRAEKTPEGTTWKKSWRATNEGGQTLSLTRRLRNSLSVTPGASSVAVGTNVIYAAIHQFGGVIRAKKGPFLAIPMTGAARSAGSPRNMPGLGVAQSLKGQFMMVDGKTGTPHFLLKRQVTIPARPFLGASEDDKNELLRVLQVHYAAVWNRA